MKKLGKKVLLTFMCGIISCTSANSALAANVVTVSSVPGETSSFTAVSNASSSSNYVSSMTAASISKTSKSNVVAAVGTPDSATESVSTVTSSTAVKSSNTYTTRTVPVITAVNAIDDNGSTSNDVNVSTYTDNTQNRKEVAVIEATGNYDDSAAQASLESSTMGFCVILSSSPTGTMKDITG